MNKLCQALKLFFFFLVLWNCLAGAQGERLQFFPQKISKNNTLTTTSSFYNTTAITSPASHNGSRTTPTDNKSGWQGYVGAVIAVVFFGSNFIPVKKFETGDGMFFQWVFCSAIWIAGLITNCVRGFPQFYPLAMLGGFLWATGNVCSVPVIKTIGLGLGLLIWGSFNLLSGWASGRFGWFGLHPEVPNKPTLNYLAIGFAMLSAVFWMFVKSQPNQPIDLDDDDDDPPLLSDLNEAKHDEMVTTRVEDVTAVVSINSADVPWEMRLTTNQRRFVGISLSIFSGILYGLAFTPVIYIKNNYHGVSQSDIDYVFGHFCGIFLTSTTYFVIYCMIKKNRPKVYPQVILPAIASGAMWAAADIGWFIANNFLSEAVSFPIITTGPGIIGSLWGVFVFREVKGCGNYVVMLFAYTLTITGAVLAGFSKS